MELFPTVFIIEVLVPHALLFHTMTAQPLFFPGSRMDAKQVVLLLSEGKRKISHWD